ncbi:unnamed protein product [Penicillium roqueforti FM164]|uniref:Genomic scaffold, ProqFM164S01 n=1 Tax=Penicillium roqueforti (strain FM164) TaxID=1365484 RepID=W6PQY5_PENRF|nr:unnamed protein product [Penicillium roqueforti FM164]
MERKKGVQDSYDSLELYQEAIRLLSPLLQMRDPKVIGAYVLLCYLEDNVCLRAGLAPSFGGMCGIFFYAFEMNGFSSGLLEQCFGATHALVLVRIHVVTFLPHDSACIQCDIGSVELFLMLHGSILEAPGLEGSSNLEGAKPPDCKHYP